MQNLIFSPLSYTLAFQELIDVKEMALESDPIGVKSPFHSLLAV